MICVSWCVLSGDAATVSAAAQPGKGMQMRMRGFEFARLQCGELRYGSPVQGRMEHTQPYWFFGYLQRGSVRRGTDGASFGTGEAGVIAPDMVQDLTMSADAELL